MYLVSLAAVFMMVLIGEKRSKFQKYCIAVTVNCLSPWLWEWVRSLSFPSGEGAAGGNSMCLWRLGLGFYSFSGEIMDGIYHFNSV